MEFFEVRPEIVACDLHPDYASTRTPRRSPRAGACRWCAVQHHHAHVAACMAEHGLEGPVLGFVVGRHRLRAGGTSGAARPWSAKGPNSAGQPIRPFRLPGGDRAVREPRRAALGLLYEMLGSEVAATLVADRFSSCRDGAAFQRVRRRPALSAHQQFGPAF